ncbi:oligosaccharide flippase family protein, partial [Patescibacteria group bacterium]|nr:oligosaccharide flippase family protein [Patescibacteria group bacterium]
MEIKGILSKFKSKIYEKKNTSFMLGGRLIAQAVPILLTPLFTRIYSPAEFGYFGAYVTIVSIIAMLSNGRYCLAIMLPKEQSKAQRLVWISILLTSISTIVFAIILLFGGTSLFSALNISTLNHYILTLVLSVLFIGVYEAFFYYFLREKRYKEIAINIIIQAGFLIVTRLITGFWGYTEGGLMYSYLASYLAGTLLFLIMSRKDIIVFAKEKYEESIFKLMSVYSKFPKYSLFADLLKNFTFLSPNLFLNKVFGAVSAGYYALSDKILGSPVWFLTSSFGDVLKQEASE